MAPSKIISFRLPLETYNELEQKKGEQSVSTLCRDLIIIYANLSKYNINLDPELIEWIKQQIRVSKDGKIKVLASDLKKSIGKRFAEGDDFLVYQSLIFQMSTIGINVDMENVDGHLLIILYNN